MADYSKAALTWAMRWLNVETTQEKLVAEVAAVTAAMKPIVVRERGPRPWPEDLAYLTRLWHHLPRVTRKTEFYGGGYDGPWEEEVICPAADATTMTSEVLNSRGIHAPVLDIDFPAALVPSTSDGHYHLVLEKAMTWRQYKRLLRELGRAGILEQGFVRMSIRRGFSSVRVPWVKKN